MSGELIDAQVLAHLFGLPGPYYLVVPFDDEAMTAARKKKGWTQANLGARLGHTQGWVSRFETRRDQPSAGQMGDIARVLELGPWDGLVIEDALVAYMMLVGEFDHPSADAREWFVRAEVAEHRGNPLWKNYLDRAVFWEAVDNTARDADRGNAESGSEEAG